VISVLDSKTRIVILQHPDEASHPLNTARLAMLGLSNAELHVGRQFDASLWNKSGYKSRLLFPGEGASVLMPTSVGDRQGDPYLLVVLDGTWRHARHCLAHHPELQALPRVTLPVAITAHYRVRHSGDPAALSTIEAIAAALDAIEAPDSFDSLLAPFRLLVAGQIAAMGADRYHQHHVLRDGSRAKRKHEAGSTE